MNVKDHYKTLGVARTANADAIKKAYRKLARRHHPDISHAADANDRMAAVNEAHAVLSDPVRRTEYDTLGSEPQAGAPWRQQADDQDFAFSDATGDGAERSAFFEQLFGRGTRARHGARASGASRGQAAVRGSDQHARIELDIQDAYEGAERQIALNSTHLDEQGQVVVDERNLQVHIPKGVHEGQHIRLAGRGNPGSGGAPAGDLLLEVMFKPDPRWRAEGRDLVQGVRLAPWEAMLGATATIATPGGQVEVHFPAGWKAGRKLRLKGRGIPGAGKQPAGHLFLDLEISLPAADSDAARAAYATLAGSFPGFEPRANR